MAAKRKKAKKKTAKKTGARKAAKKTTKKRAKKTGAKKVGTKRRKAKKAKGHAGHPTVANPNFGGNKYDCYGKKVRAGKSTKLIPRVFCSRVQKAA